ncbi:MAG: ribonuclease III [Rhodobacteraceae bacterium]|nr:ribonuclease III [Paracoccaceae bacterium]
MSNLIRELETILGYKFEKKELLKKSLTHKSFNNKSNNEKLEFLGDRVLGLIISKKLLETYPEESEGIIDKKFANLVNKKTCSKIANNLSLNKYMILGKSHKTSQNIANKVIGDCLEAIIGAIYLDKGLQYTEKFVLRFWRDFLENSTEPFIDAKTQLQEYSLKKFKELPKYTSYKKTGPQHRPIFKTEVQIPNSKKFIGTGTSKKNAQQNAANKLLYSLKIL